MAVSIQWTGLLGAGLDYWTGLLDCTIIFLKLRMRGSRIIGCAPRAVSEQRFCNDLLIL